MKFYINKLPILNDLVVCSSYNLYVKLLEYDYIKAKNSSKKKQKNGNIDVYKVIKIEKNIIIVNDNVDTFSKNKIMESYIKYQKIFCLMCEYDDKNKNIIENRLWKKDRANVYSNLYKLWRFKNREKIKEFFLLKKDQEYEKIMKSLSKIYLLNYHGKIIVNVYGPLNDFYKQINVFKKNNIICVKKKEFYSNNYEIIFISNDKKKIENQVHNFLSKNQKILKIRNKLEILLKI